MVRVILYDFRKALGGIRSFVARLEGLRSMYDWLQVLSKAAAPILLEDRAQKLSTVSNGLDAVANLLWKGH